MGDIFSLLSDDAIKSITRDMDTCGYGVVENCIDVDALAQTRQFVQNRVAGNGGEYLHFTGRDAVKGTLLQDMSGSANFVKACQEIYRQGTQQTPPPAQFHMVLRCLSGETGKKHAYIFHYDSYVLTALVPIIIPVEGQSGDLIMFPNTRKVRRHYTTNLIDKLCLDNPLSQYLLRAGVRAGWLKPQKVRMVPGNVYFFWGCRTIHTNEPCDINQIRSTALMHYADPHVHSPLRQKLRSDPKIGNGLQVS